MKKVPRIFLLLFLLMPAAQCSSGDGNKYQQITQITEVMEKDTIRNRQPAVAGTFYPGNPQELKLKIEALLASASPSKNFHNVIALISPHAGYVYSGTVAASAFNQLDRNSKFDNIFIIGSSHHTSFDGAAIYSDGNFITPLGTARVNMTLSKKLLELFPGLFKTVPEAHQSEHSLEVQLPFLQYIYKDDLQIVPIIIGTNKMSTIKKIAEALDPFFGGNNLFVISTDFSHYPDYTSAVRVDNLTAKAIMTNSPDEFASVTEKNESSHVTNLATSICGWTSVMTLLDITANKKGIQYHNILYRNSGDAPYGDKNRVVGYYAIAITGEVKDEPTQTTDSGYLNEREKRVLLHIARVTIETYLKTGKIPDAQTTDITEKLKTPAGAFVTLTEEGKLRGCIGQFSPDKPLYRVVQEMAVSSATRDYRFSKVTERELDQIKIEISVLTPMRKINSIDEIQLGKHGIYVSKGGNSGTFLPQVADQTGWNKEEFVAHCARDKAGIGWDGWKDAELYVYEAYVFGEE